MKRRGVDVEQDRGTIRSLRAGRTVGKPDVLTNRDANALAGNLPDRTGIGADSEIAVLIEHAVVGKKDLVIDPHDPAVAEYGGRIGDLSHLGVRRPS